MIRINLLGKKKSSQGLSGAFGEGLSKIGFDPGQLDELRPALVRLVILGGGIYLANYIPNYLMDKKIAQLDAKIAALSTKSNALKTELATKKDIRKQMDQLKKEEVELRRQLDAVTSLDQERGNVFRTVDSLVVNLPEKVWLRRMGYDHSVVRLAGASWDYFSINEFVRLINESTSYSNVIFGGIRVEQGNLVPGVPEADQGLKTFEIEFTTKAKGGA